jgi:hypothetical protein
LCRADRPVELEGDLGATGSWIDAPLGLSFLHRSFECAKPGRGGGKRPIAHLARMA